MTISRQFIVWQRIQFIFWQRIQLCHYSHLCTNTLLRGLIHQDRPNACHGLESHFHTILEFNHVFPTQRNLALKTGSRVEPKALVHCQFYHLFTQLLSIISSDLFLNIVYTDQDWLNEFVLSFNQFGSQWTLSCQSLGPWVMREVSVGLSQLCSSSAPNQNKAFGRISLRGKSKRRLVYKLKSSPSIG